MIGLIDGTIILFNYKDNSKTKLLGHTDLISSFVELKDGKIASGSNDKTIKIWDSDQCIQTISEHQGKISSLIVLNDGNLVSGSFDNTIRIWDSKDKFVCIMTLIGHKGPIYTILQWEKSKIVSSWD